MPIGLFSQAMAGAAVLPHPAQREALEGRVEASSPRCLSFGPRRHRARHRAFSVQRTCSTKADGQRFPSYRFSPKERMRSYWSPTKSEPCDNFEKKMKASKCCTNTQTSSQMPTGGISAYSVHITGSGFLRDSVPCLTLPKIKATVLKPHRDKATDCQGTHRPSEQPHSAVLLQSGGRRCGA